MPTNVWFWVFIAVLIAAVVVYAIWKNHGINFEFGLKGMKVGTQASPNAAPPGVTRVAEEMRLKRGAKVKNIVGNEAQSTALPANQTTEVAKGMVIGENAEVDSIVGNRITKPNEPRR